MTAVVEPEAFVLYDGECPVCSAYVAISRLKALRPEFAILDARQCPELVSRLRAQGFGINDSVLVRIAGRTYAGAAATRMISDLGSANPFVSRAALYAIGGAPWGEALYPWLRAGRSALLRLMGRPLIG